MAFTDFETSYLTSSHSPTESARFGHTTDRIAVGQAAANSKTTVNVDVQEAVDESAATIIILRFPAELIGLLRDIRLPGRHVFPGGSIVYWQAPTAMAGAPDNPDVSLLDRSDSTAGVLTVLEDSFDGYVNHYSVNPLIPRGIVVAGYSEWARSSMSDPRNKVFVVRVKDNIVGVAVVAVSDGLWEIELASISRAAQRQGHYLALMTEVVARARQDDIARVVISTQSHNIAVQRAWARLGFLPISSIETVHIVRDEALL